MVLLGICGMILWLILSAADVGQHLVGLASQDSHPAGMKITADNSLLVLICAAASRVAGVAAWR